MSVKWKPQSKAVLLGWVSALDEPAIHQTLTDWEQHFIASISFQLAKIGSISQKQHEILDKIYAEKTK